MAANGLLVAGGAQGPQKSAKQRRTWYLPTSSHTLMEVASGKEGNTN